jgi:hypothetical protein
MSDIPGYDAWKTASPDDGYCEFCGAHEREFCGGWQPARCTSECRRGWRDPDAEYEAMRDEPETA